VFCLLIKGERNINAAGMSQKPPRPAAMRRLARRSVLLLLLLRPAAPAVLFGPTANLLLPSGDPDYPRSIAQLLALVADAPSWPALRAAVVSSRGALHARDGIVAAMSPAQRAALGAGAAALSLPLSLEAGGAFCGAGAGARHGAAVAALLRPLVAAGAAVDFLLVESVFSRTRAACPAQAVAATAAEAAAFAAAAAAAAPRARLFLYDALPHFRVGAAWPANVPSYGLELGATLAALRAAFARAGVALAGYWADCPFDYSAAYPNASAPLPAGAGWARVAAAAALVKGMGLEVGKTFNSQAGGAASDALFHAQTVADYGNTSAALRAAGAALDHMMVETWYAHPLEAAPETAAFTTAFTALDVARRAGAGA